MSSGPDPGDNPFQQFGQLAQQVADQLHACLACGVYNGRNVMGEKE